MRKMSRRDLLKAAVATVGGLAAIAAKLAIDLGRSHAQGEDTQFIPFIAKGGITHPPSVEAGVVQVRNSNATFWDGSGYFWENVNQSAVDDMFDQALMMLTGTNDIVSAWSSILPQYQAGQGIAVKVSFNNTETDCNRESNWIDAIIEPVNAMARGMKAMGVREQDIWVYDANRVIPARFRNGCLYPGVKFYSRPGATCGDTVAASGEYFTFSTPSGDQTLDPLPIANVITSATYLINLPIMKLHGMSGVTLGFKNHYGSTPSSPQPLHYYSAFAATGFQNHYTTHSPLLDLSLNTHIRSKTVLIVGDGLFGALHNTTDRSIPRTWSTFGNAFPNMLFVSRDPVAIDCVMADWLYLERQYDTRAGEYLKLAEASGLGVWERRDPRTPSSYQKIDLRDIQLT